MPVRKIVLASHGSMAEGVLSAARMIMGACPDIQALDLARLETPADIARCLEQQIAAEPEMDFMIFCDILGGSVHHQLSELCRYPNVYVVSGMTLSMILECHLNAVDIPSAQLLEKVVQSARDTITVLSHQRAVEQIERGMEDDVLW